MLSREACCYQYGMQEIIQDRNQEKILPKGFLPPEAEWPDHVWRLRDALRIVPGAPLYHREFAFTWELREIWRERDGVEKIEDYFEEWGLTPKAEFSYHTLGWCEAAFEPPFEEKVLEDRGETEVVQDVAGRGVLYFKNRRSGFMPEYLTHPVQDRASWEENVLWRLDPDSPERLRAAEDAVRQAQDPIRRGWVIKLDVIGGYMYLRSLIGPEELLYMFYDDPELIHDLMQQWLKLAKAQMGRFQRHVAADRIIFAEDISFNHGPLISPAMIREFLFPYYQELLEQVQRDNAGCGRELTIELDTDGKIDEVVELYQEIGFNAFSPCEAASGSDVLELGHRHPNTFFSGGMDKRVLSEGTSAIDAMVERLIPPLRARGGFIPTIDHMIPVETPFSNYCHYRRRCRELGE